MVNAVTTVDITGTNGIKGIRGLEDITKVHVVSDAAVSIVRGDQDYPMSCVENDEGLFVCDHTFEKTTTEAGEYVLTFKQGLTQIFTWPFIVDGRAPVITKLLVEPVGDKLNLTITAYDEAFMGSENCAGIQSIEVTTEEDVFYKETIGEKGLCVYEKSVLIKPPKVSGDFIFTAIVQDNLGQFGQLNFGPINVDFQGPEIQDEVIVLSGETKLETISSQPSMVPSADIYVKVKDDNLTLVTGDLSSLSRDPELKSQDSSRTARCTKQGLMYECVFEGVQINPGATEVPIKVTATDFKGHVSTKNISAHFAIQTKLSEVTYFGRDAKENCFEGTCYYKGGANKLFMHITSQDVEIKPYLITVSASGLSTLGYIKMASCNDTGDYYTCYGYLPVDKTISSGSRQTVALTTPSTDSLGSPLKGISSSTVIVDQDPPVAKTDLNFSVLCPITGEKAYLTINVTDEVSPIIRISASPEKITTDNFFQNDCQRQGNIFVCKLELSNFVSYAEKEDLAVTVKDLAGNQIEDLTIPIQVCEAETQVPPESLSSITSNPTQKIDKRMMTFMPIRAYLPLDFNFKNQNTEIVDLDTTGCVGTKDLAGRPYFINEHSKQPILVVPIGGREQLLDSSVTINCTIKVYEKRGVVRYTKPELEELVVRMPTFNQELGTIDIATQEKLTDIVGEINDLQDSIDDWHTYLDIIDTICTISNTFNTVFSTISAIETVVYGVAVGFSWVPGVDTMWTNLCSNLFEKLNSLRSKVNPIGSLTKMLGGDSGTASNDKLNVGIDSFLKLGCLVYNCGLCSPEGVLQAVNIVGSYVEQTKSLNDKAAIDEAKNDVASAEKDLASSEDGLKKVNEEIEATKKELASVCGGKPIENCGGDPAKVKTLTDKMTSLQADKEIYDQAVDLQKEELSFAKQRQVEALKGKQETLQEGLNAYGIVDGSGNQVTVENLNSYVASLNAEKSSISKDIQSIKNDVSEIQNIEDGKIKRTAMRENRQSLRKTESQLDTINRQLERVDQAKKYDSLTAEQSAFAQRQQDIQEGGIVERMDPFEDRKFAAGCLCGPGIVYAKEKLKQLNCREYKCIEENAKNGLPITSCEIDFDQGKCVYYDGPMSNEGFWDSFFTKIWQNYFWGEVGDDGYGSGFAIANQVVLTSRKIMCPEEYLPFGLGDNLWGSALDSMSKCSIPSGWRSVTCSLTGAYLTAANYESYFQNPWQPGLRELEGEDFCSGIPLEVEE
ncbi:hypothetical protein JXA48_01260 [Candidatus Woesearchaeota archaeon]|nr:hypothetical protein [Candidatus Woesearchaeota archaeon]